MSIPKGSTMLLPAYIPLRMLDHSRLSIAEEIAPLSLLEKRKFLARVVRASGPEITGLDKLEAIRIDNDLAGHGTQARANASLAKFLSNFTEEDLAKVEKVLRASLC